MRHSACGGAIFGNLPLEFVRDQRQCVVAPWQPKVGRVYVSEIGCHADNIIIRPPEICELTASLPRRIQIRVLAHRALHLLAFFFVVEQHLAVAEVSAFDFALCLVEE